MGAVTDVIFDPVGEARGGVVCHLIFFPVLFTHKDKYLSIHRGIGCHSSIFAREGLSPFNTLFPYLWTMLANGEIGVDGEDLDLLIEQVERSYGIKFTHDDFTQAKTLGDITKIILLRIGGTPATDCTSQQGFYKLRDAISRITGTHKDRIKRHTLLIVLFPRDHRRQKIKILTRVLGIKNRILESHRTITFLIFFLVIGSLIGFFIDPLQAAIVLAGTIFISWLSYLAANEFPVTTVGELAKKLALDNYTSMRRDPLTVNPQEVKKNLEKMYEEYLGLRPHEQLPDAPIV